ncbi:MAG TPA: amino acid adenylation domain-containing protein [Ktedonobacteraceae bacterium]|nr:amino acid adenylation domain-containing protein [Ktedonobacteraceae bacterium]
MSEKDSAQARRALLEKYRRGQMSRVEAIAPIPRRSTGDVAPLSFGQQQLWLLAQLLQDVPAYNECVTLSMPGPLDVAALERSFNELLKRHEVWRTSFPLVEGQPVQQIHPALTLSLPAIDLRHLPLQKREVEARRLATEEALRPFDLAVGPLLRASLMQLDDEDYRLFLCLHHIIFDGVTIYQVFLPELRSLYETCSRDQTAPSPLPDLSIQYADYAIWQRERLQGDLLAKQLTYWKKQLAGAPTTLELPADRPRPPVPTYRGASRQFALSPTLTEAIKTLSQREGVTLFMTLLAAFNTLLYRYTGQEDILIGTASAGRNHPDTRQLMGVFINMLVMRTDLQGDPGFRDLLQRVREVTLEAQAHQDVPFEYIVKELQPERENGQNPLFQTLLMLEPSPPTHPSGWTITHLDIDTGTAKFDLSLILEERPDGLLGRFEYSTDLFDDATIERMVQHWLTLLEGIVAHPDKRLSELPLLTEQERHQLLVEWNNTTAPYPATTCVHHLFEQQVERDPDATALLLDNERMTYRALNEKANQLAHYLQRLGVGPEVLVGLYMERSFEMVISLLAILKAGGAYLPLDLAYPRERLAFMLQDTEAPVLLTRSGLQDNLPSSLSGTQTVCLDQAWEDIGRESVENVVSGVSAENLAYVMYTSGSTGKPKGVEIVHRNINRLVFGINYAQLDETQTILHMAPISFDASTLEVWGALLHGARCVLFPARIPTPKSIGETVRKHNVTLTWLTASLFNAVIDEAPQSLQGVTHVLTGGEALSVTHVRRALAALPTTQFSNGYGPHESTTFACCYAIPRPLSETGRSIPIGRPIGNTRVYVLDRYLTPVPIGVPGELYIGGAGVARGYMKRPDLTHERFIADPFSDEPGAHLYKTGDRVRYLPDGTIEFLGRLDQQVKLRGFRIEPGEIEVTLGLHPAVREALVRAQERGGKRLVAYVVPFQGQQVVTEELRRFLKDHLPEYMVPSDFVLLDALPMTPNGKVDVRALPEPAGKNTEESYVAPTLPVHHQLVRIWEDLLEIHPIGMRDNFFSLGGHSLLAARMVDRIEQVCGKRVALSTLYGGATIEHLAEILLQEDDHEKAQDESRARVVVVQPGKRGTRPFFFLHGDWYGGGFYCLNLAQSLDDDRPFYLLEPYDFERQQEPISFEEMAAAHIEALRAVQPKGPYLLGGFCNGGLLAYEIARQLQAEGQQVDLLVLIDPADPKAHKSLRKVLNRVGKLLHLNQNIQLNWFLRYLYLRIPSYRAKVQETAPKAMQQVGQRSSRLSKKLKLDKLLPSPTALRYQWSGIYRWVAAGYTPEPYDGELTLFWSSEAFSHKVDWRAISGSRKVEDYVFPGTHMSCRNENLHILAERLDLRLREH